MNIPHLQLDPLSALDALRQGAWLVDVREPHERARLAYAVDRCIPMPLSELERRHRELPRDADLLMACAAGGRSQQAMLYLLHQGHGKVRNLAGGMAAWMAHGLPVAIP